MTHDNPNPQLAARRKIVQAANRYKIGRARKIRANHRYGVLVGYQPKLLNMRQIQLAVRICRSHGLVDDATLTAAGWPPKHRAADEHREAA